MPSVIAPKIEQADEVEQATRSLTYDWFPLVAKQGEEMWRKMVSIAAVLVSGMAQEQEQIQKRTIQEMALQACLDTRTELARLKRFRTHLGPDQDEKMKFIGEEAQGMLEENLQKCIRSFPETFQKLAEDDYKAGCLEFKKKVEYYKSAIKPRNAEERAMVENLSNNSDERLHKCEERIPGIFN
ncbi:hypothetical protein ACVIQT_008013 [Bradyrhizobium diazoefficiens]